MSRVPIVIKGHLDDQGLAGHLETFLSLSTTPCPGPCLSGRLPPGATETSGSELLPRAMSVSVVLLQLGSAVMSMPCVTTGVFKTMLYSARHTLSWPGMADWSFPSLDIAVVKLSLPHSGKLASALRKDGPTSHGRLTLSLESTLELTLLSWLHVSQP